AAHHAEAEGGCAGLYVEERLLLNRIRLDARNVPPRDLELASLVRSDLAHAGLSFENRTFVTARIATNAAVVETVPQLGSCRYLTQKHSHPKTWARNTLR